MRGWVVGVVLVGCVASLGLYGVRSRAENGAMEILQVCEGDLDRDEVSEQVLITCRSHEEGRPVGGDVIVMKARNGKMAPVWRHRNLNPWKLRLADVDGDDRVEIVLGVWKKSPKDPVMAKRVFVYFWNGEQMAPRWLGSRLSRRFEDFDVRDTDGDGKIELMAMEVAPGKPKRIGLYRWRSFGFEWVGSAEPKEWEELTK